MNRRLVINLTFAAIGAALLVVTVQRAGWAEVQQSLTDIGGWYFVVMLLGGVRFAARSRAWQVCAGPAGPSFRRAFSATLAGDALGNVTPLGLLASEPAKVFFVSDQVSTVAAVSSVAAENAFYVFSILGMLGAGALVFLEIAEVPAGLRVAGQAVVAAVMLAGVAGVWTMRRQPAILSHLAHLVAGWTGRGRTAPDRLREIEVHFYAVLTWPWTRIVHVIVWEAAFHAAAVFEVFLILQVLPVARHATVMEAFVLETTGRLIVVAFKFVPYRLGVDEAGSAMIARALALDPAVGVALALVRRLRILFWNAVGLVLLAIRR